MKDKLVWDFQACLRELDAQIHWVWYPCPLSVFENLSPCGCVLCKIRKELGKGKKLWDPTHDFFFKWIKDYFLCVLDVLHTQQKGAEWGGGENCIQESGGFKTPTYSPINKYHPPEQNTQGSLFHNKNNCLFSANEFTWNVFYCLVSLFPH